jgi:uncharacterized membrane protein YkvA (DUF1232 family)
MVKTLGSRLRKSWWIWYGRCREKAERILTRPRLAVATALLAYEKADRRKGPVAQLLNDIAMLARLVRAWGRGEYRDVSKTTLVAVVGGLVYLLSPIDAIPDAIPFAGLIDDAAVLGWVIREVRAELNAFALWEAGAAAGALTAVAPAERAPGSA